jgi:hypothetical protein
MPDGAPPSILPAALAAPALFFECFHGLGWNERCSRTIIAVELFVRVTGKKRHL